MVAPGPVSQEVLSIRKSKLQNHLRTQLNTAGAFIEKWSLSEWLSHYTGHKWYGKTKSREFFSQNGLFKLFTQKMVIF